MEHLDEQGLNLYPLNRYSFINLNFLLHMLKDSKLFGETLGREIEEGVGEVLEVDVYHLCALACSYERPFSSTTTFLPMKVKGIKPNCKTVTT